MSEEKLHNEYKGKALETPKQQQGQKKLTIHPVYLELVI